MLKYPRPGAVKTRLIPALGEARACELYRDLVRHTLAEVERFAARGGVAIEARVAGAPDEAAVRAWLGGAMTIRHQGEGDLGQRMERAVHAAFAEADAPVVVIGGDCPQLAAGHLAEAFAGLARADAVIGPAADGGYYLIGLRRRLPSLFHGIRWGGQEVLAQTLAAARALSVDVVQLEPLRDVDEAGDLVAWAELPAVQAAGRGRVSVVIPACNEAPELPRTLDAARCGEPHEIIVVDGGSTDATREIARARDAIVLTAPAYRATQMNRGAAIATGEWLLFLHADTLLPADYAHHVRETLAPPGVVAGAFEFAIADDFPSRRWIERATNFRARRWQSPYGDQALFLRRETFRQAGGFPELPIMEDYELVHRLRARGKISIAPAAALTSGRRWRDLGAVRTTLLNGAIILAYRLGVPPARLAGWYRGRTGPRSEAHDGIAARPAAHTLR